MKRLGILFTSETFLFIFFSTIILIAGTIATPYRYLSARPGTVYDGTEFYTDDFSIYAGDIMQGQKGRWTVIDKHTTEPHQGTLIHEEYLLWGKLLGLIGIDNITAYHLARLFFGAILLISIYSLLRLILPEKLRKLSFFLILFSAGMPIISKSPEGQWIIRNHMEWFTEIDVFQRFTVLMHYLLGNTFFILSLTFAMKIFTNRESGLVGRAHQNFEFLILHFAFILSGMGMALTHPVSFIVFSGMLGIYLLFSIILRFILSNYKLYIVHYTFKKEVIPSLLFLLFSIPVLLYYRSQFTLPVWNQIAAWEGVTQYIIPLKDYAVTIGPTFFLAPFGLLALFFSKKSFFPKLSLTNYQLSIILLSWILSFFLLIFYSYPILTISQVRFMQNFIFIPFGILAAVGIIWLANIIKSFPRFPISLNTLYFILTTLTIVPSLPAYYRSMQLKFTIFSPNDPLMFPDKPWVEAIRWLGRNSNPDEAVITAWHAGHAIPYLGGNTVYVGHIWATIDRQKKEAKLYKFLQGQMSEEEMKEFLKETTASYLFFGYQEQFHGLKPETIPFFTKIFDNGPVQIYRMSAS